MKYRLKAPFYLASVILVSAGIFLINKDGIPEPPPVKMPPLVIALSPLAVPEHGDVWDENKGNILVEDEITARGWRPNSDGFGVPLSTAVDGGGRLSVEGRSVAVGYSTSAITVSLR